MTIKSHRRYVDTKTPVQADGKDDGMTSTYTAPAPEQANEAQRSPIATQDAQRRLFNALTILAWFGTLWIVGSIIGGIVGIALLLKAIATASAFGG
jgi:hypothetical protein